MLQTRREKEIIRENRIFRERQYAERRQKDYEEALEHEFRLAERARLDYKKRTALQLKQHLAILEKKVQKKHQKNCANVNVLINDIIDLSMKITEYRKLNGSKEIPSKLLRQWKILLLNEKPLVKPVEVPCEEYPPSARETKLDSEVLSAVDLLDKLEFLDYLQGKNDWSYVGENSEIISTEPNNLLIQIVDDVIKMCTQEEPLSESLQLPLEKLKLCIVGKPYSGKSSLVKIIAETHNLEVIDAMSICKSALEYFSIHC